MEVRGRVEPEVEPHLPSDDPPVAAPPHVHIRLQRIRLPRYRAQELHVHFIMVTRVRLIVRELYIRAHTHAPKIK